MYVALCLTCSGKSHLISSSHDDESAVYSRAINHKKLLPFCHVWYGEVNENITPEMVEKHQRNHNKQWMQMWIDATDDDHPDLDRARDFIAYAESLPDEWLPGELELHRRRMETDEDYKNAKVYIRPTQFQKHRKGRTL